MNVKLIKYNNEYEIMVDFIINFWKEHNNVVPSIEDANENLKEWTKEGHILYFINANNENVGFVHLGSRGAEIDWLEDIFVLPKYQRQGIGTPAITTRGFNEDDMIKIAHLIDRALSNFENEKVLDEIKEEVIKMCKEKPLNY